MVGKDKITKEYIIEMAPQKDFEERFAFIKEKILRKNTAIAFEYIIFLIEVLELQKSTKLIVSAINKNMIVYTAMIIEGCLHYCLKEFFKYSNIDESKIMPAEWKQEACKKIYSISEDKEVCGIVQHKKVESLKKDTNFIVINRACKKAGILVDGLFEKAENLRKKRNKIHLAGLREIDSSYTKADTQKYFNIAREIIDKIETKIQEFRKK